MTKPLSPGLKLAFPVIIALLILIDQVTKWWVIERYFRLRSFEATGESIDFLPWLFSLRMEKIPSMRAEMTPWFDLVMAWNKGVSFSMFTSESTYVAYILIGVALTLSLVFFYWLMTTNSKMTAFPLVLIVAGALSNVWDRVRFGAVADFLYFHVGSYGWPAFNLADSCIVAGVALLAYDGLFLEPKRKKGYVP